MMMSGAVANDEFEYGPTSPVNANGPLFISEEESTR